MTIDMSTVTTITLNNQDVTKIEDSLGNVLWQKGSGPTPPTPTTVIDKFPDAVERVIQTKPGGPISDYTSVVNSLDSEPSDNEVTDQYPTTVDGETYPIRIKLYGSRANPSSQPLLQINVASNSNVYLICSSSGSGGRTVYIDGVETSYITPDRGAEDKLVLPMTAGVHTIGFSGNTWIWGIIGDLNVQNNNQ